MTSTNRKIIWTSSLDLSPSGVSSFCQNNAAKYGKTEQELRDMTLMDLAITYMRADRNKALREVKQQLCASTSLPILVILDKADLLNTSHMECHILSGEKLSDIFPFVKDGLSVTFFSDGRDIRCESLTSFGADHYLFREITSLKNLSALIQRIERGEAFTESELSQNTKSLHPQVSALLNWDSATHPSLSTQIVHAQSRPRAVQSHTDYQTKDKAL